MKLEFFMAMEPPTATAQMRKWRVVRGSPKSYEPARVRKAKQQLDAGLAPYRPSAPLEGPLLLIACWFFPHGKSHSDGDWRISRPDTDNLQKLLKDRMTAFGFWHDDAQVCYEIAQKEWSNTSGIYIRVEELAPPCGGNVELRSPTASN